DLSGDPSFREVLRRVREVTLGAFEHQELPFEKLVADLQPERSLDHSPLFQVQFELREARQGSGVALEGLRVHRLDGDSEIARSDLALFFTAESRGLLAEVIYSTDLFERSTARRMLKHLQRLLEQIARNADLCISELELLAEADRRLL